MNEEELESFVTGLIDKDSAEMLELAGGGAKDGRKTESVKIMGIVAKHCVTDRVSGKDVCED